MVREFTKQTKMRPSAGMPTTRLSSPTVIQTEQLGPLCCVPFLRLFFPHFFFRTAVRAVKKKQRKSLGNVGLPHIAEDSHRLILEKKEPLNKQQPSDIKKNKKKTEAKSKGATLEGKAHAGRHAKPLPSCNRTINRKITFLDEKHVCLQKTESGEGKII